MFPNLNLPKCPACDGMGRVVIVVDGHYTTTRCSECDGQGRK